MVYDFLNNMEFDVETVNNNTLKSIIKDLINIKSLKEFHIETLEGGLYICLFDLSQLNSTNIVKYFNNMNIEVEVAVTQRNPGMSYMPTTEIVIDNLEGCEQPLMIYDA